MATDYGIVALEEHLLTREIAEAWAADAASDAAPRMTIPGAEPDKLFELGRVRIADMDDQGVDVQVLSVTTPGVQSLDAARAVPLAAAANDAIADVVAEHPDRFDGLATLPTTDPHAAADELRRAVSEKGHLGAMVYGRTGSMHLGDAAMEPIWAAAAGLRAPVVLHPQTPTAAVRDAYYTGIGAEVDALFSGPMIGWHYETGVELLHMIFGGVFDRHPDLQVVVGHWGEAVLFYADRIGNVGALTGATAHPFEHYLTHNVLVMGSGVFSQRAFRWTREVVGIDRIVYATDYPYIDASAGKARRFLDEADLTADERVQVASGNWDRVTRHLR
ncbi:amidohydrolase family protein [Williamsia sp. MIQD14]|uniref:amidohydrolase family protein n=1 Tax=Williamsia sp. MIQD14 TaxID=3425703 RepID=UPI003DA026C0